MPDDKDKAARRKKRSKRAFRELGELLWARRGRLGLGLAILVVNRLTGFILPASTKFLLDDIIGKNRPELLPRLAMAAGAATLVQAASSFALTQLLGVAAQRSINDLRKRIHRRVARLPVRYFDENKTGALISRVMNDAEGIRNLVGTGFVQLIGGAAQAAIAVAVLFYLNWRLTSMTFVALALFGGVILLGFTRLRPVFRERGRINADATARLSEFLSGIRVVKAYTAEKREELVFARHAHRLFRNIAKSMTGVSAIMGLSTALFGGAGVMILVVGGHEMLAGRMTYGGIFMYTIFLGLVIVPLIQMTAIGTQLTEGIAGLDRINEILGQAEEAEGDEGREPLGRLEGRVAFESVDFEYLPDQPVLRGVNFEAPPGTTTALVGSSGSGKSTLIGLVMAFNRPKAGRILIDGRDLAGIRLRDYRSHLGVVLQDNFLFDGTIAENIAYARPGAPRAEIERAAAAAHCDEFVRTFPQGLDTVVGERGVRLSGGQRQRLAIARAILADPRILILDEATSSLDSESEMMIQDGLRKLQQGRTTFVIAHRLSTIRNANQILVLERGEIVERGTHAELMARGGRYRELHDRQYQWESNRFINPGEEFAAGEETVAGAQAETPAEA